MFYARVLIIYSAVLSLSLILERNSPSVPNECLSVSLLIYVYIYLHRRVYHHTWILITNRLCLRAI